MENKPLTGHPNNYYDELLSHICDAGSNLIFAPGEAKVELKKQLENMKLHKNIIGYEIVDKITDNQIVAKYRQLIFPKFPKSNQRFYAIAMNKNTNHAP